MDRQIRINVGQLHVKLSYGDRHAQFLPAFPDQCRFLRLAGLYFPAYKLPEQAPCLVGGALADHKPLSLPDQSGNHFRHADSSLDLD